MTCFFSIIIPTYNRWESLRECLRSLKQLEYPQDRYEVIVVDDGSDVVISTAELVKEQRIRILRQPNGGPGAARNLGASQALGDFLVFTDDDCRPHPGWLQAFDLAFRNTLGIGLGGTTINALTHNPCSAASQAVYDVMHRHFNAVSGNCLFFPSNNCSFPRTDFLELGGFNKNFRTAEDRDFCDRWISSGRTLVHASDAVVEHAHPLALRGLVVQHFQYGKGAFRFYSARKFRGGDGLSVDTQFYRDLLSYPFVDGNGYRFRLLGSILLTQVAGVAGYAWERLSSDSRDQDQYSTTTILA